MLARLFLSVVLILSMAVPAAPAAKRPRCYLTGNARKQACMCGRIAVPLWICRMASR